MGVTLFIICYLGILGFCAIGIRFLWAGPAGAAAIVYFVLTVKFGDIGAFFVGSALGRHKLVPWLSPGKTWEGAGGAILGSILMAELGLLLWRQLGHWLGPLPLTAAQALSFGVLMAVFGHAGDLVESAVKRDVGAKDSAHVVPAFGGLLDILDSPLFAAPVAWCFLTFCSQLG
jgi:phosphatidate cytidylyltransferase